jgi:hypothetical protein
VKLDKSDLQLETVISRIKAKEIDLQPNFQRGEVWDLKRRQRLIDTILRGWYVPAVHVVVDSDGREVVLDGQQRLAAIRDFEDDGIRIDGLIDPPSETMRELHGLRYSELDAQYQRSFNRFVLQIIRLTEFEPQEPNELFFRLNQSYNLTPPEKRNALHGKARDQVRELVRELTETGLLEKRIVGFSNGRLAYDDIVSRVCVALEFGTLRQHINNNVVEEFYRTRAFQRATLEAVAGAGRSLLTQLEVSSEQFRLNKGTLQTWLTYCYWAPLVTGALPIDLLLEFEIDRATIKRGEARVPAFLQEVLRIYGDRASYRVTDVSSVVARDLAIHLYSSVRFGTQPRRGSEALVVELESMAALEVETAFFDFAERSAWGAPILDSGDPR